MRSESIGELRGGSDVNKLNYSHPVVASFLLLGVIFVIIGFSRGFVFFLLGALLIFGGIRANQKLNK